MAALDFPNAPAVNQAYTAPNGVTYIWTGVLWQTFAPAALTGPVAAPTWDQSNAAPTLGLIPQDDTIPQITEGSRLFQRTYTANNPANQIEVDCEVVFGGTTVALHAALALFIDNAPDAVFTKVFSVNTQWFAPTRMRWRGVLGGGPHTFEIRCGASQGLYLNRNDGGRIMGGTMYGDMTISEVGVGPQGPIGPPGPGNYLLRKVTTELTGLFSSAVVIPLDNTIPQITEGVQCLAIDYVPVAATSRIRAMATLNGYLDGGGGTLMAALFNSAGPNAVKAGMSYSQGINQMHPIIIEHEFSPGSAASIPFRVRCGPDRALTAWLNAINGGAVFGGVAGGNRLTIEEYAN